MSVANALGTIHGVFGAVASIAAERVHALAPGREPAIRASAIDTAIIRAPGVVLGSAGPNVGDQRYGQRNQDHDRSHRTLRYATRRCSAIAATSRFSIDSIHFGPGDCRHINRRKCINSVERDSINQRGRERHIPQYVRVDSRRQLRVGVHFRIG